MRSNREKANTFAEYLYNTFQPNNANSVITIPNTTPPTISNCIQKITHTTVKKVKKLIAAIKNEKFPGFDQRPRKLK